jgi:hypothetical protein
MQRSVTVGQPAVSVAVSNPRRREEHRRCSSKRNTSQELDEDEEGSQETPVTKKHKTASTNQVKQVEQEEEKVDEVEQVEKDLPVRQATSVALVKKGAVKETRKLQKPKPSKEAKKPKE